MQANNYNNYNNSSYDGNCNISGWIAFLPQFLSSLVEPENVSLYIYRYISTYPMHVYHQIPIYHAHCHLFIPLHLLQCQCTTCQVLQILSLFQANTSEQKFNFISGQFQPEHKECLKIALKCKVQGVKDSLLQQIFISNGRPLSSII